MTFDEWWEDFVAEHEEWKYADSAALRRAAFQAGAASRDAEIARLKAIPVRYRRMAFNAQLQDEVAELGKENDQLREQVAILLQGLEDAATSLETIALRSYGDESYLNTVQQMRGYAASRAGVARETLTTTGPNHDLLPRQYILLRR